MSGSLDSPLSDMYSLHDGAEEKGKERAAYRTHACCHAARLLFLFGHGAFVFAVACSLGELDQANWWLMFLPLWICHAFSCAFVVASWFVSCPYIRMCLNERRTRLGDGPSIFTEVLPEIVLAIPGFLFLVVVLLGELALCTHLDSSQRGRPRRLPLAMGLLMLGAILAVCNGILVTANSPLFLSAGGGFLVAFVAYAATGGEDNVAPSVQALVPAPIALASIFLLGAGVQRLLQQRLALAFEEFILRVMEVVALGLFVLGVALLTADVARGRLDDAAPAGHLMGLTLCTVAGIRARIYWWEVRRGPIHERMFLLLAGGEAMPLSTSVRSELWGVVASMEMARAPLESGVGRNEQGTSVRELRG